MHIRISLGSKFKLQQTASIFWNKFPKKGHFWSKTDEVNINIEFCKYKLV